MQEKQKSTVKSKPLTLNIQNTSYSMFLCSQEQKPNEKKNPARLNKPSRKKEQ